MELVPADARVWAWKPPVPGVREVLRATFAEHAYPPHTHDTWTLFLVDAGAVAYDLDRRGRLAEPAMVSALPPHVVHDGRPASGGGYRMRVIYLEPDVLGEALIGPAVDRPFRVDAGLRRRVGALHAALACRDDALEAETRLHAVADELRATLAHGRRTAESGVAAPGRDRGRLEDVAEAVRAALDADLAANPSIAAVAAGLGVGPTAAARAFRDVFGIPPHAYRLGRRLDAARARILDGQPLADIAAELGFTDQAHLTRRFKRFLGTTPGAFRTSSG